MKAKMLSLNIWVDIKINKVETRVGFNLEYGDLENGNLDTILISKIWPKIISKDSDGNLEFNLENGYLEK